jgi:hypothetical protein
MARFIGKNTDFTWFSGVVEDRHDPLFAGRLRVRCLGFHTDNKSELPTEDLPWAMCVLSTASPGISGLGQSPSFLVEGSWVWGYFRDSGHQEPVIIGSLPGKPYDLGNPNKGFSDPNRRSEDEEEEEYNQSVYPKETGEVDTNRLAVNDSEKEHTSLTTRKADRENNLDIPTADFDTITAADGSSIIASDSDTWSQPVIPYSAVYPYNHVFESEQGHIKEYDDSWEYDEYTNEYHYYTRIHERHKSGTGYEIDNSGNIVKLVKASSYEIIDGDHYVNIKQDSDITINGRHKIFINKDGFENNHYDIHVGANANINIQVDTGDINMVTKGGRINVNAGGDYNVKVGGNYTLSVDGNKQEDVAGSKTSNTTGAVVHRGATIDLNP